MTETSASLLERIRSQNDSASWQQLVDLYTPLIRRWLRRAVRPQDVDDQVQEVLAVLVRRLPTFQREPRPGSFRQWLRSITLFCLGHYWRARRSQRVGTEDSDYLKVLDELEDPHSDVSRAWDEEHDRYVVQQILQRIKPDFEPSTWEVFHRYVVEGIPAEQVAAEFKITLGTVFIYKSRILSRLRREAAGLIE